jgi:predicted transcriptional regulator
VLVSRRRSRAGHGRNHPEDPGGRTLASDINKFTQRRNWLFYTQLSPVVREVYTVLLSFAWGNSTVVWPSVDRIAEMARIGRTVAQEALNTLENLGFIDIESRPPAVNRYTLRDLSKAEIEQICGMSRAEIATCELATRTSRNPTRTRRISTGTSRIPAVDRSDSGHEVNEHEEDELKEDKTKKRNTPPTPAASAESPPAGGKTSPAYGRGQEEGGQTSLEDEKRIAPAISPSNYMGGPPDQLFSSLREKLLSAKRTS